MDFCRDTWTHNLGNCHFLPHLAIKTGDAFELSFVLPGEKMGSLCQWVIISCRSRKSTDCSCRGVGALRGGFKEPHLTRHPAGGFKEPAETLTEQLSGKISLSEWQLVSLNIVGYVYACLRLLGWEPCIRSSGMASSRLGEVLNFIKRIQRHDLF